MGETTGEMRCERCAGRLSPESYWLEGKRCCTECWRAARDCTNPEWMKKRIKRLEGVIQDKDTLLIDLVEYDDLPRVLKAHPLPWRMEVYGSAPEVPWVVDASGGLVMCAPVLDALAQVKLRMVAEMVNRLGEVK